MTPPPMALRLGETDDSFSLLVASVLSSVCEVARPALTLPVLDERAFLAAESSELPDSPSSRSDSRGGRGGAGVMSNERA
jgi:hypothetical protein